MLRVSQGPGRSSLAEDTPGANLTTLVHAADVHTRRQAAAAASVLLEIVAVIKDFMASEAWQQVRGSCGDLKSLGFARLPIVGSSMTSWLPKPGRY